MVMGDHAKVARQLLHLRRPERRDAVQARDQHERRSLPGVLVVELRVADRDLRHGYAFMPISRSIALTSSGRANGVGAGSPGFRSRPIERKKFSRPGGEMIQSIT